MGGVTESSLFSIRTSQIGKIGYKRDRSNLHWDGLQDVDNVAIACLDDPKLPRFAEILFLSADAIANRLSSALKNRQKDGLQFKPGHMLWLSLYEKASSIRDTTHAGSGLACINVVQIVPDGPDIPERQRNLVDLREYVLLSSADAIPPPSPDTELITIAQAKKGVALSYDIPERDVKITINDGFTKRRKGRIKRSTIAP
ncbi:MAG: hypothetical protein ABW172_09575 [Candidatus Binatia bacterium]